MRWNTQETALLEEVRKRLGDKLSARPQYPEVVGDRKLLRFLRGHNYDINKACEMINGFLDWRISNNIDAIRKDIIDNNLDSPDKFPHGIKILKLVPQVVVNPDCQDLHGNPISVETLVPASIWSNISVEDFMTFRLYGLEYVSILLEQISHQMEKAKLGKLGENSKEPYGCVAQLSIIRCMNNASLSSFTKENKEIAGKIITTASDNYPEVMAKCYLVNTPWIFGPIYAFAKLFLAAKTVSKIVLFGHDFIPKVANELPPSSIPDFLGGTMTVYNQRTPYDVSEGGPLWCEDMRKTSTPAAVTTPTPAPTTPATSASQATVSDTVVVKEGDASIPEPNIVEAVTNSNTSTSVDHDIRFGSESSVA
eukprot:gene10163-21183_t